LRFLLLKHFIQLTQQKEDRKVEIENFLL